MIMISSIVLIILCMLVMARIMQLEYNNIQLECEVQRLMDAISDKDSTIRFKNGKIKELDGELIQCKNELVELKSKRFSSKLKKLMGK